MYLVTFEHCQYKIGIVQQIRNNSNFCRHVDVYMYCLIGLLVRRNMDVNEHERLSNFT